mmetsp:Transcript_18962/g.27777  ORF Transcript_18962/g.27777 Transcript_18962/m.27777 type:complete len:157 (-) Transcript_18962:501-971(-)
MSDAAKDADYEKKRAEVIRKLAIARAEQEKKAAQKPKFEAAPEPRKFGTHIGITCDGCSAQPIIGYRWRCRSCKNHDLCDACYEVFKTGKLLHANARRNPVSMVASHHEFYSLAEQGAFKGMSGQSGPTPKAAKKIKPNEPCPCGSGKKYKKCCRK